MVEGKSVGQKPHMHVLYLSYDGLTDPLGQSQILPYLCRISSAEYRITIVSFEKSEQFQRNKNQISILCDNHKITWVSLIYHKSPPVLSTLYDLIILRQTVRKLHEEKNFSIVHCRSYITALTGIWLKHRFGLKFIFDMRGFWVDERIEGGLWNIKNPIYSLIYKYFKGKEKKFINKADAIVVLTEAARQQVLSWNINASITTIPTCVDLMKFDAHRFAETDRKEIRSQLGVKDEDYILLYLGSLGTWYLYQEMILFFRELKKIKPSAKFLFVTQDTDKVEADPDFIVQTVGRDEVPRYIYSCDASICFIKPSFSKKGSSATKMAEVLAMGLPLITNPGWGDIEFLKRNIENIFVFDDCSEVLIGEFLKNFTAKKQSIFFYEFYSLENGVEKYSALYKALGLSKKP